MMRWHMFVCWCGPTAADATCTPSLFLQLIGIHAFRYNASVLPPDAPLIIPTNCNLKTDPGKSMNRMAEQPEMTAFEGHERFRPAGPSARAYIKVIPVAESAANTTSKGVHHEHLDPHRYQ